MRIHGPMDAAIQRDEAALAELRIPISKPSAVRPVSSRPVGRRKPVAAISPSMQWNVRGVIEPAGASSSAASMIRLISVKDSR